MTQIRDLFDSTRALTRPIEKVITYQNRAEAQLRAEISEYVVTEHIEESFSDLLKKMQSSDARRWWTRDRRLGLRLLWFRQKFLHEISRLCPRPRHESRR